MSGIFSETDCANQLSDRAASLKAGMRARLDSLGYSAPGVAHEMGLDPATLRRYLSNTYPGVLPVDLIHAWFKATGGDLSPVRQQLSLCGYTFKRIGCDDAPLRDEVRLTGEIAHLSGDAVALLVKQWADGVRTQEERTKALPVLRKMRALLDRMIETDERKAKPAVRKS
jgi:hypothetical protein